MTRLLIQIRQLAIVNEELKNHDRQQQEFINIAAHELRTPIQPILSLTEVLRSKIKDTEQLAMLDAAYQKCKEVTTTYRRYFGYH